MNDKYGQLAKELDGFLADNYASYLKMMLFQRTLITTPELVEYKPFFRAHINRVGETIKGIAKCMSTISTSELGGWLSFEEKMTVPTKFSDTEVKIVMQEIKEDEYALIKKAEKLLNEAESCGHMASKNLASACVKSIRQSMEMLEGVDGRVEYTQGSEKEGVH